MTRTVLGIPFAALATGHRRLRGSPWQYEGSVAGRGRSIPDDFAETPGKARDGSTGEPAVDRMNRLDEDLGLLAGVDVDANRPSIS